MLPVWAKYPDIIWGSIGWRMGAGEDYWCDWCEWYRALTEEERRVYKDKWIEPDPWQGFFEFIDNGTPPPWSGRRRDQIKAAAVPPVEGEYEILSPARIQGLIKYYFKSPPISVYAIDEEFDALYCDSSGFVWGVRLPTQGRPIMKRVTGRLIGNDNAEIVPPIT